METVREQLVKRPAKQSDIFVKYGAWAVAAIIITAAIFTLVPLGEIFIVAAALLTMLVLWGAYYVSGLANVEYEYCIAGAEFSVDKIVNQSKRKTLCSFNLKSAAGFYKTKKELSPKATARFTQSNTATPNTAERLYTSRRTSAPLK